MGLSFEIDRRRFLKSSLLAAGTACGCRDLGGSRAPAALRDKSDVIIRNALVHSIDPRSRAPIPSPWAVTGSSAWTNWNALQHLADARTQIVDAGGQTIVPGFVDAHNHAVGEVLEYEVVVGNPFDVEFVTIESVLGKLTARAAQTPLGHG